ncbi:MAG: hypothetical protein EP301_06960, partial [Gammaproteobacteria bacterium]
MRSKVLVAVIFLGALTMVAGPAWRSWQSQPPDFSLYPAGDARKTAFFNYLRPLIDQENDRWLQNRARLKSLRESSETGKRDRLWLASLADFFDVPTDQPLRAQIDALLAHVDEVPRSLALAQAA